MYHGSERRDNNLHSDTRPIITMPYHQPMSALQRKRVLDKSLVRPHTSRRCFMLIAGCRHLREHNLLRNTIAPTSPPSQQMPKTIMYVHAMLCLRLHCLLTNPTVSVMSMLSMLLNHPIISGFKLHWPI